MHFCRLPDVFLIGGLPLILKSQILIRRSPEQIARFLGDLNNVSRWDRGVSGVRVPREQDPSAGIRFETLGHPGKDGRSAERGRMAYRVAEVTPDGRCRVELTSRDGNARFFRRAEWLFHLEPAAEGTILHCAASFELRRRWLLLAPVFYFTSRAIGADLEHLRQVLESEPAAS